MVRETTDATFERDVLRAEVAVLVDFWAPWCGPCDAVTPILEDIAKRHGERMQLLKVNVDENVEAASRYGVLSLPTVIVFAGGRPRETVIGARGPSAYERALAPWL
ncbi:MAG: thioredoxin [Actinomycetota bacterium]|nr:thioredoxin [Actinomycetota bacterium]